MDYTPTFYDTIRSGVQSSAAVIAPMLAGLVPGKSVIDVGCGEGWWLKALAELGFEEVLGIDGDYVDKRVSGIPIIGRDLGTCSLDEFGTFDLALSLEVAEHLHPERAEAFVAELCTAAPVVAFSAAVPGQGGAGHVNEQWQSWWAALFARHDFWPSDSIRPLVWRDPEVEPWYAQNLLVYARTRSFLPEPALLDVVHPSIFGWRVAEAQR